MAKIEIYSGMFCGFCHRAKALLAQKNASFKEIDVTMNPMKRSEMNERSGGKTSVPQIFINDEHVGGCDELFALEREGKLDSLLVS